MKNRMLGLLIFLAGFYLTGCATNSSSSNMATNDSAKTYIGMFSGAVIGGVAGAAIVKPSGERATAATIGALIGTLIGGGIGMILDEKDQENAAKLVKPNNGKIGNNWQHYTTSVAANSNLPATTEKTEQNKLLSFWKKLPSIQWFINDSAQTVG